VGSEKNGGFVTGPYMVRTSLDDNTKMMQCSLNYATFYALFSSFLFILNFNSREV